MECPNCHSDKLISYGKYERNIGIFNYYLKINIQRMRCKNCGMTHAVIPSFVIPYYQPEKTYIYKICIERVEKKKSFKTIIEGYEITRQLLYQWVKRFNVHLKYLRTTIIARNVFKSLINDKKAEKDYQEKNQMYFMQRVPT